MKLKITASIVISILVSACGGANEADVSNIDGIGPANNQKITVGSVLPMSALNHPYSDVIVDGKTKFTAVWSVGSTAYHHANDASNVFYLIADSAVGISCDDASKILDEKICPAKSSGKVFPFSTAIPSIIKYSINDDGATVTVKEVITLKDSSGIPITGLLNPIIKTEGRPGFDLDGKEIEYDANALDSEALVKLSDGTFWIADEFASSLVHVDVDGRILKRLIPVGYESLYTDVSYPVEASLPTILTKRHINRGIESLAVNPNETYLYFIMQSPLDNPDIEAFKISANVRLYKMNIDDPLDIEEYLYVLESPEAFIKDNLKKRPGQNDVKISEMLALGDNRLMVLEHISFTTKIYTVAINSSMILTATESATLEQNTAGINPVRKQKVFDTDLIEGIPKKIEGMANMGNGKFLLINDNDFAVEGANTKATLVSIDVN